MKYWNEKEKILQDTPVLKEEFKETNKQPEKSETKETENAGSEENKNGESEENKNGESEEVVPVQPEKENKKAKK